MEHQEGVELLALGMFFGATSDSCFHNNQERLKNLSDNTVDFQNRAEVIEQEIAQRKTRKATRLEDDDNKPKQMQFL